MELEGAIRGVVPGKNGRLFLGSQGGFDLRAFTAGAPFSEPLLAMWRRTLERRSRELEKRGIPYVFYIVPDAHTIFVEDLPDEARQTYLPPGELFLAAMQGVKGVTFIYPRDRLLAAKGGLDLYRKNDTHWSEFGSFIGYGALCDALAPIVPLTEVPARDVAFHFRRSFGDLGVLVEPERVEEVPIATIRRHVSHTVFANNGVARVGLQETESPTARRCRAMFFRDSSMSAQAPYVTRSFSNVLMAGTTNRIYLDAVDDWRPDIVISHVGERRLLEGEIDHQPEMFDDVFKADYRSPQGKRLLQGMLELRDGQPAKAVRFIDGLADDPELAPDHAFAAAQICLAANDPAAADLLITKALAARPDHASYLALSARILATMGRNAEAAYQAGDAVKRAPYNAYFHEVYGYMLIHLGAADKARQHLDRAVAEISDSSNLWHWCGVAREAAGDLGGAAEAAAEALRLFPDHAAYRDRMERFRPAVAVSEAREPLPRLESMAGNSVRCTLSAPPGSFPSAVAFHYDSEPWATVPFHSQGGNTAEFLCDLPPVAAAGRDAVVEVREPSTDRLLGRLELRDRTPLINAHGLRAADVLALHRRPLFSASEGLTFDGARLVVSGFHLPPEGDPAKLGVALAPGVDYTFEYPFSSEQFGQHYWYWPNARWSGFKLTINLPGSTAESDPFRFRFVYPDPGGGGPTAGLVWIPTDLASFVGFPTDATQLTRVQTYENAQTVTFSGFNVFKRLEDLLHRHGMRREKGIAVLDWGCGHGRVTRHFIRHWPEARIFGVDIDAENVAWCQRHLGVESFALAPLWPPSPLAAESFDAVFGVSVMTHLSAEAQQAWLEELARVLKPNALALLSFHGAAATAFASLHVDQASWQRWLETGFNDGYFDPALQGKIGDDTYYRVTHQSEAHVRRSWATHFDVVAEEREVFGYQDVAVLRRR